MGKAKTKTIRGSLNPTWEDSWAFEVPLSEATGDLFLYFRVYDYDLITSDDFLGHVSVRLMDALIAGSQLTSGWRALLRTCVAVSDRLEILKDDRLQSRPLQPYRLEHVPGQETSYDLKENKIGSSTAIIGCTRQCKRVQ